MRPYGSLEANSISGIFIDRNDVLYAIDSETNGQRHPGWKTAVRVGSVSEKDKVAAFIPGHTTENAWGAAGGGLTKYSK